MDSKFELIISALQKLRERHGSSYEENCEMFIKKYGEDIRDNMLVQKCGDDKTFAKQLCVMNCVPSKYWDFQ